MFKFKFQVLVVLTLVLSGCGFQPINDLESRSIFDSIELEPAKVKNGNVKLAWEFDKLLSQKFHDGKKVMHPLYKLQSELIYEVSPAVIQGDSSISRSTIRIRLNYHLLDEKTGGTVAKGSIMSADGFDSLGTPFANYISDEASKEQLLPTIIADLRYRLYGIKGYDSIRDRDKLR